MGNEHSFERPGDAERYQSKKPNLATMSDAEWADAMDGDDGMHANLMRDQRRKRAVEMVVNGSASSVTDALRKLGADV